MIGIIVQDAPGAFIRALKSMLVEMLGADQGNEEHEGYYCLRIDRVMCPCGRIMDFFEPEDYHLVVVWEEKDDIVLLKTAAMAQENGVHPRIEEYKVDFGPSIEFYDAREQGMFNVRASA